MPGSKRALLILACLMLAGGILYWRKQDGGAGPAVVRENTPAAAAEAGKMKTKETAESVAESRAAPPETVRAETDPPPETAPEETEPPSETPPEEMEPSPETMLGETEPPPEWIFATEPLLVNINTAGQEELEKLPGIGPAKAAAILAYRAENGPFRTIEEVMKVPGIKEGTFNRIKAYVTV